MANIRDVHLLVLEGLADWEPGYAIAHLNRPAPGVPSKYRVRTVGFDAKPVRSIGGLTLVPDMVLGDLDPAASAMLILPGADLWSDSRTDPAFAMARRFIEAGVPIAAMCGATLGLARAGLLDDRRHTSNDKGYLAASGYKGGALYVDEPAVEDRGVITGSAMAPLEFARLILERLDAFPKGALEPWYRLFKNRDAKAFGDFMQALGKT